MDKVLDALVGQNAVLAAMLAPLGADRWALPSACDGWSISDVVLHLAQTNELAAASAEGRLGDSPAGRDWAADTNGTTGGGTVDDAAGAAVERERGAPGADVHLRWKTSCDDLVAALRRREPSDRLQWVVGDLAARTLATTRVAESWIHTGDVAAGLGVEHPPTERIWHIARLAHRTVPYAFARAGRALSAPETFRLTSPVDPEKRWTFGPHEMAGTTVAGPANDLCLLAGQRARPAATALVADGPDAASVLELVRTFA
jgi:uncharacterized protein (TIGR03084 family)